MRVALIAIIVSSIISVGHWKYTKHVQAACEPALVPPRVAHMHDNTVSVDGSFYTSVVRDIKATAPRPREIVLMNSPGGYVEPARDLAELGIPIRASGERCTSACPMILTDFENVCIDETIETVVFHSVIVSSCEDGQMVRRVEMDMTEAYVDSLPSSLRERLQPLIEREQFISVPAAEFLEYFPDKRCKTARDGT